LDQLEPQSPIYNVAEGLKLRGDLDQTSLEMSINWIIGRHEVLRTNFIVKSGTPVQVVASQRYLKIEFTDLSGVMEQTQADLAQRLSDREARRPFDLSRDVLIRALLLRLGPAEHILVLTIHHIVIDLWSLGIFYRELSEAYRACSEGRSLQREDLPLQYPDFAIWDRSRLHGESLESLNSYWKSALSGSMETHHLMLDRPRPPRQTYRGARETAIVASDVASSLLRLSQRRAMTEFVIMIASFETLLYRYSEHEDISVGFPIAHRTRPEVSNLIGFFVNTLVLKCNFAGNPSFAKVLRRVREASLGAYLHQDLPFEKLVSLMDTDRSAKQTSLFQVMFSFNNISQPKLHWPGLDVTKFDLDTGTAKFDLTVIIQPTPDLKVTLEYNQDLFNVATVKRILGHYLTLLAGVAANPDLPISNLPVLSPPERFQLLEACNDTQRPFPQSSVHELFERQVDLNPNAVAVVFEDQRLTYAELNGQANALARGLREMGVKLEVKVGICVQRSLDLIIGLLAILKTGGAYVPIDPDYPQERTAFIIRDADIHVLLTQTALLHRMPTSRVQTICMDTFPYTRMNPLENEGSAARPDTLAYIIYTSGSTGKPKGVEILHQGIGRLLFAQDYIKLDSSEVILHQSSLSFDLSTFEIWAPLLHGGTCVLFPGSIPIARELGETIRKHHVTTIWLTSTLFNALIDDAPEAFAPLRHILVGGEALSVPHICRANKFLPEVELINGYGPTEATTFATTYLIPKQTDPSAASIPIGRPISNTQVYILDQYLQPVPIGVAGELYIGGPGLARGYVKQPELTAAKFIPNPFSSVTGDRLYKSGDRVRWLPSGEIEFLGRLDGQIKIRGFRVELGEIEAALARHPDVKCAAAAVHENPLRGKQIVAYAVLRNGTKPAAGDLQNFLRDMLPEFMVPADYVFLQSLPTSTSGKVNRLALPAPEERNSQAGNEFLGPRDRVETDLARIWEGLLGRKPISIRTNFYDLGGNSLLMVRVVAAIERAMGIRLPLSVLISSPTIEQLAASLKNERSSYASSLVAIQPKGTKPSLFCVHGGGGDVQRFVELARELGPDQPFYGLRSPEFNGRHPPITVQYLAGKYIQEVRRLQPQGPFYLAGASFGGLVAYEMANQLREQNEDVAMVALFDTGNPAFSQSLPLLESLKDSWVRFGVKVKERWMQLVRAKPGERPQILLQNLESIKGRIGYLTWRVGCRYFYWRQRPLPVRLQDTLKMFTAVSLLYRPGPYPGRITLFKAKEEGEAYGPDPKMGWGELAQDGVEVFEVPGDHMSILDQPRVAELADRLRSCLSATQKKHLSLQGQFVQADIKYGSARGALRVGHAPPV
jgi:aspartate racemase